MFPYTYLHPNQQSPLLPCGNLLPSFIPTAAYHFSYIKNILSRSNPYLPNLLILISSQITTAYLRGSCHNHSHVLNFSQSH